jgi:hypothetical protein
MSRSVPISRPGRWFDRALGIVLLGVLGASPAAQAALVTLGGPNFDFVYDNSQPGFALYGAPLLTWNSIVFTPSEFGVSSADGQGLVSASYLFQFDVVARPGIGFSQLTTHSRGDYVLSGAGSSVSVGGTVSAAHGGPALTANITASPYTPLNLADGTLKPWLAMAALDVSSLDPGLPESVTVTLSHVLTAITDPQAVPSLAFVQQKFSATRLDFQLKQTDVTQISEPGGLGLVAAGGLGLLIGLIRPRRRQGLPGTGAQLVAQAHRFLPRGSRP